MLNQYSSFHGGPDTTAEPGKENKGIRLVDSVVRNFRVAKLYRENTDRVNHMDFSSNGEMLISSAEDDQIVIYDCDKGT